MSAPLFFACSPIATYDDDTFCMKFAECWRTKWRTYSSQSHHCCVVLWQAEHFENVNVHKLGTKTKMNGNASATINIHCRWSDSLMIYTIQISAVWIVMRLIWFSLLFQGLSKFYVKVKSSFMLVWFVHIDFLIWFAPLDIFRQNQICVQSKTVSQSKSN